MQQPNRGKPLRTIAGMSFALVVTAVIGTGLAKWSVADANTFYMQPIDRYAMPAYARQQPVAETFWQAQDGSDATHGAGYQSVGTSTAMSAQPE